jgi:hypothetical protein
MSKLECLVFSNYYLIPYRRAENLFGKKYNKSGSSIASYNLQRILLRDLRSFFSIVIIWSDKSFLSSADIVAGEGHYTLIIFNTTGNFNCSYLDYLFSKLERSWNSSGLFLYHCLLLRGTDELFSRSTNIG